MSRERRTETSGLTKQDQPPRMTAMSRTWLVWCLILSAAGCSSLKGPHVEYDAPRVTGRVVDGETGQPIHRAAVRRWSQPPVKSSAQPEKGATQLRSKPVTYTDEAGRFIVPAKQSAYLLLGHGGAAFSAALLIQHPNYTSLVTNLTGAKWPAGEKKGPPEIEAGDLRLVPEPK